MHLGRIDVASAEASASSNHRREDETLFGLGCQAEGVTLNGPLRHSNVEATRSNRPFLNI